MALEVFLSSFLEEFEKAPVPHTITLGIGIKKKNVGGVTNSQTIAPYFLQHFSLSYSPPSTHTPFRYTLNDMLGIAWNLQMREWDKLNEIDISKAEIFPFPCLCFFISLSFHSKAKAVLNYWTFIYDTFLTIKHHKTGCGEVSDPESERSPHRGPAIIFSEVLCMKWVESLVGWCGENTQVLIFYDKNHLHLYFLVFFELMCISFTYNSFVSFFG